MPPLLLLLLLVVALVLGLVPADGVELGGAAFDVPPLHRSIVVRLRLSSPDAKYAPTLTQTHFPHTIFVETDLSNQITPRTCCGCCNSRVDCTCSGGNIFPRHTTKLLTTLLQSGGRRVQGLTFFLLRLRCARRTFKSFEGVDFGKTRDASAIIVPIVSQDSNLPPRWNLIKSNAAEGSWAGVLLIMH